MASSPLDLPPELLHHCLVFADPVDVVHFGATCREAYEHVEGSATLWKACFLAIFDPPIAVLAGLGEVTRTFEANDAESREGTWQAGSCSVASSPSAASSSSGDFDYRQALQERIYARQILHAPHPILDLRATQAILDIATSRKPHPSREVSLPRFHEVDESSSANQVWLNEHFNAQKLFPPVSTRCKPSASRRNTRQQHLSEPETYLFPNANHIDALLHHLEALATPNLTRILSLDPDRHTIAREVVYRETNFKKASHWGPFLADRSGRVDWNKVLSLSIVMTANLNEAQANGVHQEAKIPQGWETTRRGPWAGEGEGKNWDGSEQKVRDWAGVEETEFRGTHAFLDYRSFEHFNFHRSPEYRSTLEGESEAIGDIMRLKLKLLPEGELPYPPDRNWRDVGTGFDEVRTRPGEGEGDSDDDDEDDGDFGLDSEEESVDSGSKEIEQNVEDGMGEASPPTSETLGASSSSTSPLEAVPSTSTPSSQGNTPLSFIGTSEPLHFNGTFLTSHPHMQQQPQRSIRGTVSITPDNEVHWQYIIRYSGQDQWLMNGVQVGGPKSRFGVVGIWSTANHEPAGPCGPFWYFPHFEGEAESGSE
ncbi:hypothetical protein MVLG_02005 [Microbotryum lychnidis-dioicae p1A1 Lamole]|uniref:F-box domain-containing protein n=1 Tax=Microbotryum lychnidis-dioicae (strain p1A1 Lamole / MvSl-1064) TaxID=683840 RepID=U5H3U9_USTV1|nr:hypothetical protein MVLG_02005 [Microbotryum lychnidis-dioicae p1A1 Lamole]|eukprot:KDE07732.1 hypothetical protein MVLG_02005 [Microbotryum lychnidis-dioicae p1A1 Lamole]